MKFGIHNPSWVYGANPAEAFEGLKAKAQWAETHGFVWLSVMDHLIQIGGVGGPDEPFMEGWTALSALAAVTSRIRLATLATSVAFRNPAHLAKIAAGVDQIPYGRVKPGQNYDFYDRAPTAALPHRNRFFRGTYHFQTALSPRDIRPITYPRSDRLSDRAELILDIF